MAYMEYHNLLYPERIKWIDQQLKGGKNLKELLDTKVRTYQLRAPHDKIIDVELPKSEYTTLTSEINLAVMKKWEQYTSDRPQNPETLLSMSLWEFMSNHI